MIRVALVVLALILLSEGARAQAPLSTRTYIVTDLIVPAAPGLPGGEAALIADLTNLIQPNTWDARGGPGTIHFFPLTNTLVVNQTDGVHMLIDIHLRALRIGK
jgi:hypothetical protein